MAAGQGGSCWLVVTGTANPLPESALSLYAFRPTRGALCNELPPFVQCLCRGMPMQFWSKLYGSVLVFLFVMATAVFAAEELAALRDRAERGDAQAQCALGERYRYGRGVDRDAALAFAWFQKAALQGYADGQSKLGAMYFAGRGVARNEGQFIFWTRKAAEQGHALAQGNLGWAYEEGRGVGRDARWPQNGTARPIWGCPGWRRPGIRQPSSEWAICISWAWVCPKVKKRGWRGSARQPRQAASRHRPNWAPCTPGEVA